MREYVIGFMFDESLDNVVLIKKSRPSWQTGRLNGVGGKVERLESHPVAMERQFREEAGVSAVWRMFGNLTHSDKWTVSLFYTVQDVRGVRTMEEEPVGIFPVADIVQGKYETIGNIPWLVAMAKAIALGKEGCPLFSIVENR